MQTYNIEIPAFQMFDLCERSETHYFISLRFPVRVLKEEKKKDAYGWQDYFCGLTRVNGPF